MNPNLRATWIHPKKDRERRFNCTDCLFISFAFHSAAHFKCTVETIKWRLEKYFSFFLWQDFLPACHWTCFTSTLHLVFRLTLPIDKCTRNIKMTYYYKTTKNSPSWLISSPGVHAEYIQSAMRKSSWSLLRMPCSFSAYTSTESFHFKLPIFFLGDFRHLLMVDEKGGDVSWWELCKWGSVQKVTNCQFTSQCSSVLSLSVFSCSRTPSKPLFIYSHDLSKFSETFSEQDSILWIPETSPTITRTKDFEIRWYEDAFQHLSLSFIRIQKSQGNENFYDSLVSRSLWWEKQFRLQEGMW